MRSVLKISIKGVVFASFALAQSGISFSRASAADATPITRRTAFTGTINAHLPTDEVSGAPKTVYFPPAGVLMFSGSLYCGDGDVAAFSQSHPQFKFYPATATVSPMALGYWVVPADTLPFPAPTMAQWYSIGYALSEALDGANSVQLPLTDGRVTAQLYETNTGAKLPAAKLLQEHLGRLNEVSREMAEVVKVPGFEARSYRALVAAMACPTLNNTDGATLPGSNPLNKETNGAVSAFIANQFLTGRELLPIKNGTIPDLHSWIETEISNQANEAGIEKFLDDLKTFNLQTAPSGTKGMRIDFSQNGSVSIDATLYYKVKEHARAVLGLDAFGQLKLVQVMEQYLTGLDRLDTTHPCRLNAGGSFDFNLAISGEKFNWESFPTYGACGYALKMRSSSKNDMQHLADLLKQAEQQHKTYAASLEERKAYVAALANTFLAPAIVRAAQDKLAAETQLSAGAIRLNHASCLPVGATPADFDYIATIGNSIYLPITLHPTRKSQNVVVVGSPGQAVHPEPAFAISDYRTYAAPGGARLAVANNTVASPTKDNAAFVLRTGSQTKYNLELSGVGVRFKMRSIGCSQNVYCLNSSGANQ